MHSKSRFLGMPPSVVAGVMHSNFRVSDPDGTGGRGQAPRPRGPAAANAEKSNTQKTKNLERWRTTLPTPINQPRTQSNRTPTRCKAAEPVQRIDRGPERK